jgi:outer membrane immunogenic protein
MCRNKIRFGLAGILALTISSPLFAADMPVKAPPLTPAAAVYDWTGVYVGGEVGGKWTRDNWNTDCVDAGGFPLGTCGSLVSLLVFPGAPDSTAGHTFNTSGLRAGVYAGLDVQVSPLWVVGLEGDWGAYKQSSTVAGILGCSTGACAGLAPGTFSVSGDSTSVKFGDDYSVRVRAGFLVTPTVLAYGTGGIAFQQISTSLACTGPTATFAGSPACLFNHAETQNNTLLGYTVGGGIEWRVAQNWLLRGEYRYSNFGNLKSTFFGNSGDLEVFTSQKVTTQIATGGIAYLFPIGK